MNRILILLILIYSTHLYSEESTASLIARVTRKAIALPSVSCRFQQSGNKNGQIYSYRGTTAYDKTEERIIQHYLSPSNEYVLQDDTVVSFYSMEAKQGVEIHFQNLTAEQKQVLETANYLKQSLLKTIVTGFNFRVSKKKSKAPTIILEAVPDSSWTLMSGLELEVDTSIDALTSIKMYNVMGALMSSTQYSRFTLVQDSLPFPQQIISWSGGGGMEQVDTLLYSRPLFSDSLNDSLFIIPIEKEVESAK